MNLPSPWEFVVAALALYMLFYLVSEATILDRPRRWLLRMDPSWEKDGDDPGESYRFKWAAFIQCPWCFSTWAALGATIVYCSVIEWIGVLSFVTVWFALTCSVGLIGSVRSAITED